MKSMREVLKNDRPLREELLEREGSRIGLPGARRPRDMQRLVKAIIVPPPGMDPRSPAAPGEEAIVREFGRPVLFIQRGKIELPAAKTIRERILRCKSALERRIPSVGRIEFEKTEDREYFGTGWVVDDATIITNRHVAKIFALRTGKSIVLRKDVEGDIMKAQIDFREEYEGDRDQEVRIKSVDYIADDKEPDIAFITLERHGKLPDPIPLAISDPKNQDEIALVGYPAPDPRSSVSMASRYFSDIYNVKRLAPGLVLDAAKNKRNTTHFTHDATTLGGNSGSVVLDMSTGTACGLHFAGTFLTANYAVKSSVIRNLMARRKMRIVVPAVVPNAESKPGRKARRSSPKPEAPSRNAASLATRDGYQEKFLGNANAVPLPTPGAKLKTAVTTFGTGSKESILKYTHFSVIMNKIHRMCMFSAVNIDGKASVSIKGQRPSWQFDPRLVVKGKPSNVYQIKDECYGNERDGKFSRGHMTRREDPVWGSLAPQANRDTFYVTNATPQIQPFNAPLWLGLEDYALQNARQDDMKISVFTGPIHEKTDPIYFGVKIPVRFWKIIAFIHDHTHKLCATGYVMSQESKLPGNEFIYGQYLTYQESIREIERLSGINFGKLAQIDPFKVRPEGPPMPLLDFDQIQFLV